MEHKDEQKTQHQKIASQEERSQLTRWHKRQSNQGSDSYGTEKDSHLFESICCCFRRASLLAVPVANDLSQRSVKCGAARLAQTERDRANDAGDASAISGRVPTCDQ